MKAIDFLYTKKSRVGSSKAKAMTRRAKVVERRRAARFSGIRGQSMLLVLSAMVVLLLIPTVLAALVIGEAPVANQQVNHSAAYNAAEAGVADYINNIDENANYEQYSAGSPPPSANPAFGGSSGTPTWARVPGSNSECFFYVPNTNAYYSSGTMSLTVTGRSGPSGSGGGTCSTIANATYQYRTITVSLTRPSTNQNAVNINYGIANPYIYGDFATSPISQCGYYAYGVNPGNFYLDLFIMNQGPDWAYGPAWGAAGYDPVTGSPSPDNGACGLMGIAYHDAFWTGADNVSGPVYSKDEFYVCGNPYFSGPVVTGDPYSSNGALPSPPPWWESGWPMGLSFGSPYWIGGATLAFSFLGISIDLVCPTSESISPSDGPITQNTSYGSPPYTVAGSYDAQDYTLNAIYNWAVRDGCVYFGNTTFTFLGGGGASIGGFPFINNGGNCSGGGATSPNGLFFVVDGNAYVNGTVGGQYTVAAVTYGYSTGTLANLTGTYNVTDLQSGPISSTQGNIVITGNTTYACGSPPPGSCNDVLGLIAQNNVGINYPTRSNCETYLIGAFFDGACISVEPGSPDYYDGYYSTDGIGFNIDFWDIGCSTNSWSISCSQDPSESDNYWSDGDGSYNIADAECVIPFANYLPGPGGCDNWIIFPNLPFSGNGDGNDYCDLCYQETVDNNPPTNLTIDAEIDAVWGSFYLQNYNYFSNLDHSCSGWNFLAVLNIFTQDFDSECVFGGDSDSDTSTLGYLQVNGSVTEFWMGILTHYIAGGGSISYQGGYNPVNFNYDPRLNYLTPPYMITPLAAQNFHQAVITQETPVCPTGSAPTASPNNGVEVTAAC